MVFFHVSGCIIILFTVGVSDAVQRVEGVVCSDFTFIIGTVNAFSDNGARTIDYV